MFIRLGQQLINYSGLILFGCTCSPSIFPLFCISTTFALFHYSGNSHLVKKLLKVSNIASKLCYIASFTVSGYITFIPDALSIFVASAALHNSSLENGFHLLSSYSSIGRICLSGTVALYTPVSPYDLAEMVSILLLLFSDIQL